MGREQEIIEICRASDIDAWLRHFMQAVIGRVWKALSPDENGQSDIEYTTGLGRPPSHSTQAHGQDQGPSYPFTMAARVVLERKKKRPQLVIQLDVPNKFFRTTVKEAFEGAITAVSEACLDVHLDARLLGLMLEERTELLRFTNAMLPPRIIFAPQKPTRRSSSFPGAATVH